MIKQNLAEILSSIPDTVTLVAVSKTKPNEDIMEAYNAGQRIFGENKVQELSSKYESLPRDIEWHMIGHLQRNKVKYIAPFVSLIHGVDSLRLLEEIDKQASKVNRVQDVLLQIHIAKESSKFGLDETELFEILNQLDTFNHVNVRGLMGMATFTEDPNTIINEFSSLKQLFDRAKNKFPSSNLTILSMGMSGDYTMAIENGSTMIRVGSSIFGDRNYN